MDDSTSLSGSAIELIAPTEGMIGEAVLQTVNARDLHAYLGVGKVFGAWITNRISSYDFIEHVDFEVFSETGNNPTGGRPSKEYAISLDMAKELAMVERTPKGREARRYFIECERVAHEGPRTELAAPPADADAILALMADMFAGIVKSQQSGHATALDHIDNTKAATLHYMKANLKEPAQAFYDDARARNKAAYQRDQIMLEAMRALTAEASKLNRAARQTMLERPFVWDDWYDLSRIYSEFYADQVIHRRRFLSNQISRSLDSWCKRHRRHIDMDSREVGGRYVNFYHRDAVIAWLDGGGRAIIDAHLRQGARQASLHLVGGGRS